MNLPNKLTVGRMIAVPFFIAAYMLGYYPVALVLFCLASLTDALDGKIARKRGLVTNFGKIMDPLADKIMVLTAMFSMAIGNRRIPPVIPWPAVILLLAKEAYMVWGAAKLYNKGIVAYSSMIGKVAQCAFILSLVAVYFHEFFDDMCRGWFMSLDLILLWISVGLTLCALVFYIRHYRREAREKGII